MCGGRRQARLSVHGPVQQARQVQGMRGPRKLQRGQPAEGIAAMRLAARLPSQSTLIRLEEAHTQHLFGAMQHRCQLDLHRLQDPQQAILQAAAEEEAATWQRCTKETMPERATMPLASRPSMCSVAIAV